MVLSMDRWADKVAVVTGASSGIGAAVAEQLVENGLKVAGLARRKDRLEELAKKFSGKKGKFFPVQADLSKEEEILNAFKWVKENLGPVHILINNAGIMGRTTLYNGDTKIWRNILDLNVIGLCVATREAVKDMRANHVDGHIIHINSRAGHRIPAAAINVQSNEGLNVYPASKFAVRALAETLRLELNSLKSKIKISDISPGATATELVPPAFAKMLLERGKMIEAEHIADAVVYALSTPPHVQIQELILRPTYDVTPSDFQTIKQ